MFTYKELLLLRTAIDKRTKDLASISASNDIYLAEHRDLYKKLADLLRGFDEFNKQGD